jgi:hypothetical protein
VTDAVATAPAAVPSVPSAPMAQPAQPVVAEPNAVSTPENES